MGEMVKFASNGAEAEGYLALPDGKGPGVIVLQEWWGLNADIKEIADRFAGEGFVALAPDMYHGRAATEPDEARKLVMGMQLDAAARDLSGAYDFLIACKDVQPRKVGSVGFCMGGSLAVFVAALKPLDAAVTYYGGVRDPAMLARVGDVSCPVLGHFAELDESTGRAPELEAKLREAGVPVEWHVYAGAHHSFFNKTRPEMHHEKAAAESWERTLAFFRKHLSDKED
ncbi:MAG: dienelactone hydrolase family protein [Dehalococcoidia bacterium]